MVKLLDAASELPRLNLSLESFDLELFFAPQNNGPPASFTAPESGVAQSLNFVSFWVSHTMQSNDINLE